MTTLDPNTACAVLFAASPINIARTYLCYLVAGDPASYEWMEYKTKELSGDVTEETQTPIADHDLPWGAIEMARIFDDCPPWLPHKLATLKKAGARLDIRDYRPQE